MTLPLRGVVEAPPYLADPDPAPKCYDCHRPALVDGYCRSQACADARSRRRWGRPL